MNFVPSIRLARGSALVHGSLAKELPAALSKLESLLLILAIAYFAGRTLPRAWGTLNTDFPNYYLTAHMLREGQNTARIYEWTEAQREKDHLGIEQPVVGFIPLTPVSALPVVPLAHLPPLQAKHVWILLNLGVLAAIVVQLRSITGLALHRLALLALLTFPIHHNFVLGQAYLLLLLLLTSALWLYLRDWRLASGMLVGFAFGLKVFPALFLLYFLRKRDWKAAAGLMLGSCLIVLISLAVFGIEMNRTYVMQVLPSALRGDALDPYNLRANSLSTVLHHLFILEPEWNSHPLVDQPALLAIFHPILQVLIFAPALLLSCPYRIGPERTSLEWCAFTVALVTISTSPAFYDFAILLLPGAVLASTLLTTSRWRALAVFSALYLGACFPFSLRNYGDDWRIILAVPRLCFLILFCAFGYALVYQGASRLALRRNRPFWIGALTVGLVAAVSANLLHQRGLYDAYRWRVATSPHIFAVSTPVVHKDAILFTAMLSDGYRTGELTPAGLRFSGSQVDQLVQSASAQKLWSEEGGRRSQIVSAAATDSPSRLEISHAQYPVASPDGDWLAFQRIEHGKSRLWLRSLRQNGHEWQLTSAELNVMEMSFLPDDSLVFSASAGGPPHVYIVDHSGNTRRLAAEEARYPAVSPDGRWLVFSRQQRGTWNLWLRDLRTGEAQALTSADCNSISPAWESDSKWLLYASDCGRGLWLTALCRRRVVP